MYSWAIRWEATTPKFEIWVKASHLLPDTLDKDQRYSGIGDGGREV